jgi:hypothetical protein
MGFSNTAEPNSEMNLSWKMNLLVHAVGFHFTQQAYVLQNTALLLKVSVINGKARVSALDLPKHYCKTSVM